MFASTARTLAAFPAERAREQPIAMERQVKERAA